jgi:hypothetical protein
MQTRKDIESYISSYHMSFGRAERQTLEILLDIRELLQNLRIEIINNPSPKDTMCHIAGPHNEDCPKCYPPGFPNDPQTLANNEK